MRQVGGYLRNASAAYWIELPFETFNAASLATCVASTKFYNETLMNYELHTLGFHPVVYCSGAMRWLDIETLEREKDGFHFGRSNNLDDIRRVDG